MTAAIPDNFFLHQTFEDVDLLTETVREFNLSYLQLDCGRFSGELEQARIGQVMVGRVRCNRMLEQEGCTPPGMRTFVVPADPALRMHWRGKDVCGEHFLAFPPGGELEAMTKQGFDVFTLTMPEPFLSRVARDAGLPEVDDLLGGAEVVSCDRQAMNELRREFSRIFGELNKKPTKVGQSGLQYKLEFALPRRMLAGLAMSRPVTGKPLPHRRHRALKQTMAFLEAHPDQPITVRDLCQVAGSSERTLQYAFQEHVGVTPKAFLQARRLNGVRRMLRNAPPGTKVTDAANHWGFWHMGQFAADYRKLFAELPSETLAKASAALT